LKQHADRTKVIAFSDHLSTVDGLAVLKQTAVAFKAFIFSKGLKTHLIFKDFSKRNNVCYCSSFQRDFINSLLNLI
jgi:hypothetical protein